ncbi:uncharacterized protein [Onthophagus taurus]|uniref:uncharacterized protein n=1 Tax=Onthophagus taurus TaxID=166361 RepID=UPI0039BE7874
MFFTSFWKLKDYSKQNTFLRGAIKIKVPQRSRIRDGSRGFRSRTFEYYLDLKDKSTLVCKKYFLNTINLSWGRVYRCLTKHEVHAVLDSRRRHPSSNKIDQTEIRSHIESFPAFTSHYTRHHNPNRKYLNSELSIKKMYELYVDKCQLQGKIPCKEKYYYNVFTTKYNLHFKILYKDTCKKCDQWNIALASEKDLSIITKIESERKMHLSQAKKIRNELKNEASQVSENYYACTFDLKKALAFPKLTTSIAYYKRNLYMYNCGVHPINFGPPEMFVWNETEGGRGSQEISIVLYKHLKNNVKNCTEITLYYDTCGGQNRNINLSVQLLKLCNEASTVAKTINVIFMISGHSYLPNDADFGVIEKNSKHSLLLYGPDDWIKIIKSSRKKTPYKVTELKFNDFLSTKDLLEHITNRKINTNKEPVNWLKIQRLQFKRGHPFSIFYKDTADNLLPFKEIDIKRNNKNGRNLSSLASIDQKPLYNARRRITDIKKKDMISLLPFIPPIYHNFYKSLPVQTNTRSSEIPEEHIRYE